MVKMIVSANYNHSKFLFLFFWFFSMVKVQDFRPIKSQTVISIMTGKTKFDSQEMAKKDR